MTDTDSGKILSDANKDAELVILLRAVAKGTNHIKSRQSIIFEAAADALERLTANRGSVSEERAGDIPARIVKLCESRPAFDWSNYREGLDLDDAIEFLKDDFVALDEAADQLAAIQQAVSECSGGGIKGIRASKLPEWHLKEREELLTKMDAMTGFWEVAAARELRRLYLIEDECDHPEVSREFVSGIRCGECRKTSLKETPPVKESRDAVELLKEILEEVNDADRAVSSTTRIKLREFLKSTPHQGGEGK